MKKNTSLDFASLKKLWPWMKPYKPYIWVVVFLIPLVAVVEASGPLLVKRAIDEGILKKDMDVVLSFSIGAFGCVFVAYILRVIQAVSTATAVHGMVFRMRSSLMKHVVGLSSSFHDKELSGALTTRATTDFDNLSESLNQGVLSSIIDLFTLVGCLIGMYLLSPKLTVVIVIMIPLVAWIVVWFSKKLNFAMITGRKSAAALNGFTQEALNTISAVKLLNARRHVGRRFNHLGEQYKTSMMQSVTYDALMFATLDGLSSITLGVITFSIVQLSGFSELQSVSAGVVVGFVQYVQQVFEPLKQLGVKMAMLQGTFTSIERIFGLFERKDFVGGTLPVPADLSQTIEFKNLWFKYEKSSDWILKDLSLSVPSGSSLAIVGRTGSGKSTIVKLLTKMYAGYSGDILLGGMNLNTIASADARRAMAIVPQDIVLFEGSVYFNISMGDESLTKEQVHQAAELTSASEFIQKLPGGYDFLVKENGSNLSHGQRQLIVFARALVRDPKFVILDEATSSIDPQSENLIQRAMEKMMKGRTVVMIAHRLQTIRHCEQIAVMSHGEILEIGNEAELLKSGKYYRELLKQGHQTKELGE